MKKIYLLTLFTLSSIIGNETDTAAITMSISQTSVQQAPMPIAIIVRDETNELLNNIADVIKKDLEFTQQFIVTIKKVNVQLPKKELRKIITQLSKAQTSFALCISNESLNAITWRLYDTMQPTMITGKICKQGNNIIRGWAHAIADDVWKILTNNEGFFSSRIAYCKDSKNESGHTIRKVYVADFDGTNEQLLVDLPTITIAPRWHVKKPEIFYSEYTDTNARLVKISMHKERKIISSFDGVNMLAGFSPNGEKIVYCSSRGDGSCQLYFSHNETLKRFTKNSGNNVSPIFIDDNRVCFCSDFQTGRPQIYVGNIETGHLQRITKGGYCTSPSYCSKNNSLVYHMMINGIMQLFTYNFTTKEHIQLTHSAGNKHEASWSPCGTQILFSQEYSTTQRLVIVNISTKKTHFITKTTDQCCYPHWSPCYNSFPVVA